MLNGVGGSSATSALLQPDCWHRALDPSERGSLLEAGAPAWVLTLARALNEFPPDGAGPSASEPLAGPSALVAVVKPLTRHAEARLARGIQKLLVGDSSARHLFDVDAVMPWLLTGLGEQLWPKLAGPVTFEAGRLNGPDPAARYRDILGWLARREGLLELLTQYPVLGRHLVDAAETWVDAGLEMLKRLCADLPLLAATCWAGRHPGRLAGLARLAGDGRRRNRSVLVLSFESGLNVVYKPKPMAVDAHFQDVLRWLNRRHPCLDFRVLALLDRGRYGWCEFVARADCASAAGQAAFYRRLGGQSALLYALEAADVQGEHVIASGEHPVLVDLHSLFHPRIEDHRPHRDGDAIAKMGYSTLRGILSQRDLSVSVHLEEVVEGFRSTYAAVAAHAEELIAGPLARFSADEIRVNVRPAHTYRQILEQSFQPDLLRDAADRSHHFQRLWRDVEWRPLLARTVEHERADLMAGDIPIFTARPGRRDLWTSRGEIVAGFLEQTGLEMVSRRIRSLNNTDLERQLWFVRASCAAIRSARPAEGRPPSCCWPLASQAPSGVTTLTSSLGSTGLTR